MSTFPNTKIKYTLLGSAPESKFSAIYYASSDAKNAGHQMASVNAGDPGLYVGGGTINAHFGEVVPDANQYTAIHNIALDQVRKAPTDTITVTTTFESVTPLPVSVVLASLADGDSGSGSPSAGTTFLDVFSKDSRPDSLPENYAMIYIVPPHGSRYDTDKAFLSAVGTAATRSVNVVSKYNELLSGDLAGMGLQPINVIRMCLFSGGAFRRAGLESSQVAKANFDGLNAALQSGDTGIDLVEFESGTGEFSVLQST